MRKISENRMSKLKLNWMTIAIIGFALMGVFFRFSGLGTMLYSHDEAYTSLRAAGYTGSEAIDGIWDGRTITPDDILHFLKPTGNKTVSDTISVVAISEPQLSPVYFILAHYWMRVIGYSPAAMRGLSAFLSLFSIGGMYWLCRELFKSRKVAGTSVLFISISPFSILLAQDARPYSIWASLTLLASATFLMAIRTNKGLHWGLYTVLAILGIYSHIMFGLVISAHGLYLFTNSEYRSEGRLVRYMAASILTIVTFTPWIYQILTHWQNVMARTGWSGTGFPLQRYIQNWLIISTSPFIDLYIGPRNIIPYVLRLPVLLLIVYAFYYLVKRAPRRIWTFLLILVATTSLPLILSDMIRGGILSIHGRYFASTNVVMIPVVLYMLVSKLKANNQSQRYKWRLIVALLVLAQVTSAINILDAETWWIKKLSWIDPKIAEILNGDSQPLLVVYQPTPTDLGDVLALSTMVDRDVKFRLYDWDATVEFPSEFSNIYWFHQTYQSLTSSTDGRTVQATEVVPYYLWRIDEY